MPFSILNDQLSHGWNTTAEMDVVGKYAFKASLLHALTIPQLLRKLQRGSGRKKVILCLRL